MQMLQALDAAARHGGYSAAAEELGVTHGAISHQIRELENRLGFTLFRRAGRSMQPTREAVTLLAQVRQALGMLQVAFPSQETARGRVVVGVHPALATTWLIPRLGDFAARWPDIAIEVRSTADLGDFLAPGIDIAVRYGIGAWPNAASERVADERLFPICSPDYRDQHNLIHPKVLSSCTLLRHAWQPWTPWFRAARLKLREPTEAITFSDSAMLVEAAVAGLGVALVRERFAAAALEAGRLVSPFDVTVMDSYGYYLVWRTGASLSPATELFRNWLREKFDQSGA